MTEALAATAPAPVATPDGTAAERRTPWLKWYPADWRADPRLRMCSLAARGLWIDMLGFMHEAERYGFMLVGAVAPTPEELAALVGAPLPQVRQAIEELETRGVFSRDDNGVIFSRRMVRDKAKEVEARRNGKLGGNPGLMPQDKDGVNPRHKAQKPEARIQKASPPTPRKRGALSGDVLEEFERWYGVYPHKVSRGEAERAFPAARKLASLDDLVAGVERYKATKPDDRAWANPATWLNGKRWLDAPSEIVPKPNGHVGAAAPLPERKSGDDDRRIALAARGVRVQNLNPGLIRAGIRDGRIGEDAANSLGYQHIWRELHRDLGPRT